VQKVSAMNTGNPKRGIAGKPTDVALPLHETLLRLLHLYVQLRAFCSKTDMVTLENLQGRV